VNVLIVDDQRSARWMLRKLVQDINSDLAIVDFEKPLEALIWSQHNPTDLVLLDYRMPDMDGLQFAKQFRRPPAKRDVPIILISVVGDEPVRQAALEVGVTDFLVKPVRPRELHARCKNLLSLRQHAQAAKQRAWALEQRVVQGLQTVEERDREVMHALAQAAELRYGTGIHVLRMTRLTALIAERLRLDAEEVRMLELAAPLHDLGMLAVSDAVLNESGTLSDEQRWAIREHPRIGWDLLRLGCHPVLRLAAAIALSHHERWDGSGYPQGKSGAEIPIEARIVAVADVFDALISERPYRQAWSFDAAVAYVRDQAGSAFDPVCAQALLSDPGQLIDTCRIGFSSMPPVFFPNTEQMRA